MHFNKQLFLFLGALITVENTVIHRKIFLLLQNDSSLRFSNVKLVINKMTMHFIME